MHANLQTIYYNEGRQVFQKFKCYKGAKKQFLRVVGAR